MAGLRLEVAAFVIFLSIMVISQLITVTLAMLCVAVSRDFAGASMLGNVAYTVQTFCCGFFIQSQQIPVYMRWLKWLVRESSASS
jgi:ABC-type multidrug transport system permease subunit